MNQVALNKFENKDFDRGRGPLVLILWYITNFLLFNSYLFPINRLKIFWLKVFGAKVGKGVVIKPKVNVKFPWKLTIGHNSWIGERVWIDNLDQVTIGNNCCISQGALLLTGNHNFTTTTFDLITKPISLEDGAWVGAKSTVCPGVNLASHAVLSVGSVATKNLEAYSIYQGNPAVKVKDRAVQ